MMRIFTVFVLNAVFCIFAFAQDQQLRPTDLWMGTGGYVHTSAMLFPGATTPFGWVRLSPDTQAPLFFQMPVFNKIGYYTAGYGYYDHRILGFSHTRESGTGGRDGGAFRVLPLAKAPTTLKSEPSVRFHHEDETAHPGYYSVKLPEANTRAELSSSTHCGFHRYSRLTKEHALHWVLDVTSGLIKHKGPLEGYVEVSKEKNAIVGQSRTRGDFSLKEQGLLTYFYAEYTKNARSIELWSNGEWLKEGQTSAQGDQVKALFSFPGDTDEVELKLCMSNVSVENARLNFEAEARGMGFKEAKSNNESRWVEYFNRANIQTHDPALETLFYTTLYYSSIMPTDFSDVNGDYLGFDLKKGHAGNFTYRTDMSLWDTFRTAHPLFNLIAPEIACDTVQSLMEMSGVLGVFPRLAYNAESLGMMFGSPANFVLTEAYLKNHCPFDTHVALERMWKGATNDEFTRERPCTVFGYCPSDLVPQSVSKTLENAWADAAAANLAAATGEGDFEAQFRLNEFNFRALWDPITRYFRPKNSKGEFTAFNPNMTSYLSFLYRPARQYTEGGPNHYRFSVPHHVKELISLFGGNEDFVRELNRFFKGASRNRSALYPGSRYWHGDEHDIHTAYLFNEANRPDLTQYWVRWALQERYALAPNGYDGNDDAGTLSAWFVLSSLGIYPQSGTELYWLGSPAVDQATLDLGGGHSLKIVAHQQSQTNVYVKSVSLNGVRWCTPSVSHHELRDATLVFEMSPTPETTFKCEQ